MNRITTAEAYTLEAVFVTSFGFFIIIREVVPTTRLKFLRINTLEIFWNVFFFFGCVHVDIIALHELVHLLHHHVDLRVVHC